MSHVRCGLDAAAAIRPAYFAYCVAAQTASEARKRKAADGFEITRETRVEEFADDDAASTPGDSGFDVGTNDESCCLVLRLTTPGAGELLVQASHPLDCALWADSIRKVVKSKADAHRETMQRANPSLVS